MSAIHVFSSTNGSGLFAFTRDPEGGNLPERHGPWHHERLVPATRALPHGIDRKAIEAALAERGFQMWRPRTTTE